MSAEGSSGLGVALARSGEPLPTMDATARRDPTFAPIIVPGSQFDSPCYRIPALTVTATGRVLAAWDVRADWRDLPGPFDLVLRHSDDHGRSWTPPRPLRLHEASDGLERGFGDASLLVTATGRVLCFYAGSTGASFFSAGIDGPELECWLAASDDDGLTWTHRLLDLRPDGVGGMFAASGNGVRLSSGRLLQPFVLRRPVGSPVTEHLLDAGQHFAAIARSDDDGATWALGEWIGPDCDENKIVEVPSDAQGDGDVATLVEARRPDWTTRPAGRPRRQDVLLHARAQPRRRWARSRDGGVSFSAPVPHPDLVDPGCNGGLCRWGNLLVASSLDDPADRRNSSCAPRPTPTHVVRAGRAGRRRAGYSVVQPLADGSLGVLYEAGDYDAIVFRRVTRAAFDPAWWRVQGPARQGLPKSRPFGLREPSAPRISRAAAPSGARRRRRPARRCPTR